jgi:hypothetical protein
MLNFTQKERMLLEDQKTHEQICVDKYTSYASHNAKIHRGIFLSLINLLLLFILAFPGLFFQGGF